MAERKSCSSLMTYVCGAIPEKNYKTKSAKGHGFGFSQEKSKLIVMQRCSQPDSFIIIMKISDPLEYTTIRSDDKDFANRIQSREHFIEFSELRTAKNASILPFSLVISNYVTQIC